MRALRDMGIGGRPREVHVERVGFEEQAWWVSCNVLSVEQPLDCGRMRPPTGAAGVAYWQRVDPRVL